MSRVASASVVFFALLASCANAPIVRGEPDTQPLAALDPEFFPGARAILEGMAPVDAEDPDLRVGDAALFALEFRRGSEIRRQLMLLEVVGLPSFDIEVEGKSFRARRISQFRVTQRREGEEPKVTELQLRDVLVRMRRFEADGEEIASVDAVLYEEALAAGWWPDTDPRSSEEEGRLSSVFALTLQNLVNDEPKLRELLFLVVDPPSLWSLATNLGARVVLHSRSIRSVEAEAADGEEDAERGDPVEDETRSHVTDISVNGKAALFVDLQIVRPRGATMLSGGLVGAVARHPSDPERTAVVRLLATRRGPAGK
jgi:hypothetical protein